MTIDIEYHIQFPYSPGELSPTTDDDFVHVPNDVKSPVVFLLGWIGCKDKNLARYSNLYNERGCITVRCCVPVTTLTMQHTRYPLIARRLLDVITDMSLDEHPIFFHVFSNGGCYLYQYLVNEIRLNSVHLQVRGCVMDSAPGKIRLSSIFKVIMMLPVCIKPLRIVLAAISCVWMWILHGIMILLNKHVDCSYLSGDVWSNLVHAPTNIPQLFIYSQDDTLVRCEDIEEFIERRQNRGVHVTRCRFPSSPHVMHLRAHKEAYLQAIYAFLRSCL